MLTGTNGSELVNDKCRDEEDVVGKAHDLDGQTGRLSVCTVVIGVNQQLMVVLTSVPLASKTALRLASDSDRWNDAAFDDLGCRQDEWIHEQLESGTHRRGTRILQPLSKLWALSMALARLQLERWGGGSRQERASRPCARAR